MRVFVAYASNVGPGSRNCFAPFRTGVILILVFHSSRAFGSVCRIFAFWFILFHTSFFYEIVSLFYLLPSSDCIVFPGFLLTVNFTGPGEPRYLKFLKILWSSVRPRTACSKFGTENGCPDGEETLFVTSGGEESSTEKERKVHQAKNNNQHRPYVRMDGAPACKGAWASS